MLLIYKHFLFTHINIIFGFVSACTMVLLRINSKITDIKALAEISLTSTYTGSSI